MQSERRRKRSSDPLIALHYQLAHARREAGIDAVVVADDAGFVVAGAGSWPVCEELAAYAPLLKNGEMQKPEMQVQSVAVGKQEVLLCTRSTRGKGAAEVLDRAAAGVSRILST